MSDNSLDTTTEDRSVDDQTPNNGDAPEEVQETQAAQETEAAQDVTPAPEQTPEASSRSAEEEPVTPASSEVASYEPETEPGGAAEEETSEAAVHEQPATFAASESSADDETATEEVGAATAASETSAETVEAQAETVEADATDTSTEAIEEEVAPSAVAVAVDTSPDGEASAEETEEDEDEEIDDFFAPGDWFVVHTYAGYENKVKANLASRIQSMNMEDKIYDVVVPTEEVMELKSGKMQSIQKKVFPGYILVRMQLDDDSWYVVRNTPGVTGFVGSGAKPTPLDHTEVTKILAPKTEDRPKPKLEYELGEVISVVGGAFAGYSGPVESIDPEKQMVRVLLDLFGRETPVELTFDQVTKL
jgi:transcription termination/antitermination protein NusG